MSMDSKYVYDEDVLSISEAFIEKNREAYKVLAK